MAHRWLGVAAIVALALSACSAGSGPGTARPSASGPGFTTPVRTSSPGSQLASGTPIASATPSASAAASLVSLGRDQAIVLARRFGLDVGTNGIVHAEAGPFQQFDPDRNAKISQPPPDHWVRRVTSTGQISTSSVILDYSTGQFIEAGVATP